MAIACLQAVFTCLVCSDVESDAYPNEKAALLSADEHRSAAQTADQVVETLLLTSRSGPALRMELDSIVGTYGWTDNVARWVLEKLCKALEDAHEKLGPTINDAYNKAWETAKSIEGFVIEHPVMCTIITLGVLVVVAPWVLEALGFAELGPMEGMAPSLLTCSSRERGLINTT